MRLESADLNLLIPLGALLEEQNVTRAAERLNVTQPTMSVALRKLRAHFGDELLVRHGARYTLTPLARSIADELPKVLHTIARTYVTRASFDPATSNRRFRIMASDLAITLVAPLLVPQISRLAPSVSLSFEAVRPMDERELPAALLDIDVLFMPDEFDPGLPHALLYEDEWVCVGGIQPSRPLGPEDLSDAEWVRFLGHAPYPMPHFLGSIEADLPVSSIRVATDSFATVPAVLAGTKRLSFIQRRLLSSLPRGQLFEIPLTFPLPSIRESSWWHPTRSTDSGHAWLRSVLRDAALQLNLTPKPSPRDPDGFVPGP